MTRPQRPKQGTRRIGSTRASQGGYRAEHRAVGRQLGQWQDAVQAVEQTNAHDRYIGWIINKQLNVNARAEQTF